MNLRGGQPFSSLVSKNFSKNFNRFLYLGSRSVPAMAYMEVDQKIPPVKKSVWNGIHTLAVRACLMGIPRIYIFDEYMSSLPHEHRRGDRGNIPITLRA